MAKSILASFLFETILKDFWHSVFETDFTYLAVLSSWFARTDWNSGQKKHWEYNYILTRARLDICPIILYNTVANAMSSSLIIIIQFLLNI